MRSRAVPCGLDWMGFNRSDLVQPGTESYGISYRNGLVEIQVSSQNAWYEILPETEQIITNFPVSPGDWITTMVWTGDPSGQMAPG